MDKKLEKLFDQYEGNLLNYFCGLTPKQSKEFMDKKTAKSRLSVSMEGSLFDFGSCYLC